MTEKENLDSVLTYSIILLNNNEEYERDMEEEY